MKHLIIFLILNSCVIIRQPGTVEPVFIETASDNGLEYCAFDITGEISSKCYATLQECQLDDASFGECGLK
jgi:hypothetical protein